MDPGRLQLIRRDMLIWNQTIPVVPVPSRTEQRRDGCCLSAWQQPVWAYMRNRNVSNTKIYYSYLCRKIQMCDVWRVSSIYLGPSSPTIDYPQVSFHLHILVGMCPNEPYQFHKHSKRKLYTSNTRSGRQRSIE